MPLQKRYISHGNRETLTHTDDNGKANMVDVTSKTITERTAKAIGKVNLPATTYSLVFNNNMKKGDVLTVAKLAGIMGAKNCSNLIPLCHNITLNKVSVDLTLADGSIIIEATAKTTGRTGVEMEALTAVSVAALTVYDMCKSVSHDITITDIHLTEKSGGKSGLYKL